MTVHPGLIWVAYLFVSLGLLPIIGGLAYPIVIGGGGLILALLTVPHGYRWSPPMRELAIAIGLYAACVATFAVAFQVVTVGNAMTLFVIFGAGLLLGVVGPLLHVVVLQRRPMSDLGLTRARLAQTLALGTGLAALQVAITLPLVRFGPPASWLPLLALALVVGLFEAIFFRAYLVAILEPISGIVPAVAVAALLYALYHVGYGMSAAEMVFLAGLGIVYTVAYALVRNVLVLWPLLTPAGSFFANVRAGDIELPMIAILGFADVLGLMVAAIWLTRRTVNRRHMSVMRVTRRSVAVRAGERS